MKLVVGLGNPGREYEATRHNVGFAVVDFLARELGFPSWRSAGGARVSRGAVGREEVLLVKPMTFMNLSGDAVGSLMRYYKVGLESLIVVHDELDFEPGTVRVKTGGGHGGHNGLRSIAAHVGRDFVRVRVGIGKPRHATQGADYVLSGFDKSERGLVEEAIAQAAGAVKTIIEEGAAAAMNTFNRRQDLTEEEDTKES